MFSPANTSKKLSTYADKGLYFRNAPSDILQGGVLAEVIAEDGNVQRRHPRPRRRLRHRPGRGPRRPSFEEGGGEVVATCSTTPDSRPSTPRSRRSSARRRRHRVIGFDESSRILAKLIEQGFGPSEVPIYGVDGNMGNALGENFEAGK